MTKPDAMGRYDVLHRDGSLAGKIWQRSGQWFASHMTPPGPDKGPYRDRRSARAYLLKRPAVHPQAVFDAAEAQTEDEPEA